MLAGAVGDQQPLVGHRFPTPVLKEKEQTEILMLSLEISLAFFKGSVQYIPVVGCCRGNSQFPKNTQCKIRELGHSQLCCVLSACVEK